jgi:hypothetical protein
MDAFPSLLETWAKSRHFDGWLVVIITNLPLLIAPPASFKSPTAAAAAIDTLSGTGKCRVKNHHGRLYVALVAFASRRVHLS